MPRKGLQLILVYLSLLLLLVFINIETPFPLLNTVKAAVVILFAIFIPGYLFTQLFLKREDHSETMVMSIAMSICFVILTGLLIHFLGISINAYNILNPLWFISSIFTMVLMFLNPSKKKKKTKPNKTFYLNLSLILAFFLIFVYLSFNSSSNEGFIELYWDFTKVEHHYTQPDLECFNMTCSLSGTNKVQITRIDQDWYNILFLDINYPGKYDSICIDFNHNNLYCEDGEGPIWPPLGFMIGNKTYSYNLIEDGIIIFSHPKRVVNTTDFVVSYVTESHYTDLMEFDVTVKVDDYVLSREEMVLEPGERLLVEQEVSISEEKRQHKVEIIISPKRIPDQSAKINFFVNYVTEY